jgi:hypothetical protein
VEFTCVPSSQQPLALAGTGKIVWKREWQEESLPAGCGIEFISIADSSRQALLNFLTRQPLRSVIPQGGKT